MLSCDEFGFRIFNSFDAWLLVELGRTCVHTPPIENRWPDGKTNAYSDVLVSCHADIAYAQ